MTKYGVATAVRPHTTLRRLLVHPKDKVEFVEQDELDVENMHNEKDIRSRKRPLSDFNSPS